jgi:AcrR family transcriptional regulator
MASIVSACEALLKERSFEQISMADIAKRAGISVGNLYNRFSDKDALINHVLVQCQVGLLSELKQVFQQTPSQGLRPDLHTLVHLFAERVEPLAPLLLAAATRIAKGQSVTTEASANTDELVDLLVDWVMTHHPEADQQRVYFALGSIAFNLQFDVLFGTPQRLYGDDFLVGLAEQAYHYVFFKE